MKQKFVVRGGLFSLVADVATAPFSFKNKDVSFYPPKIDERFHNPRNTGIISDAAVGKYATFVCGMSLKFYLQIEKQTRKILAAKFQTSGCGFTIAAADILAEIIVGKSLTELHGLNHQILRAEIENILGEFGNARSHCLELSLDALQAALSAYRQSQIEEFTGEKALICTCFGVSEETLEKIVSDFSLETVEEVSDICNAGDGCGSCRFLIQEIIDVNRREQF